MCRLWFIVHDDMRVSLIIDVCFPEAGHVVSPAPGPAQALAGVSGGERDVSRSGVARPRGQTLPDPVETRHASHTPTGGGEHHL